MFINIGGNVPGKQVACRFAPDEAVTCFGARGWVICIYEQTAESVFAHRFFTARENNESQQLGEPSRFMPSMYRVPLVIAEDPKQLGLGECVVKVFCCRP